MIETKEQIYGRNDMVMLDKHNKIYGSLGIAEQYVFNTAEGNPAILRSPIAGKAEDVITQFEMQGWTEQNSTTGAQLFDKNTVDTGKYVSDTNGSLYDGTSDKEISASDYILVSGLDYICATITSYGQWMAFYDTEKTYVSGVNGYASPIAVPDGAVYARFTVLNDYIDSFMVNAGQTLLPYEPYTGNKPSPSPDYPQPITNAGKYNEDTGKWEYEVEVSGNDGFPQTVTLTSDRPLTKWDKLEKRNEQWGWVYGSEEADMSSEVMWEVWPGYEAETSNLFRGVMSGVDKIDSTDIVFCNILPYYQVSVRDINGIYSLSGSLFARIVGIKSLENFQEKIQGGKVLVRLLEETFIPLTTAEQEQMNELTMNTPTTVISNNVKANMKITYKATQT